MFLEPRVAVIIHDLINEGITKVGSRVSFNSTSLPLTSPVDRLLPSLPSSDSRRLSVLHLSHINTFNLAGIPYLQSLIRTGLPSRGLYPTSRYSLCSFRKSPEKVQKKSITHNGVPNYTYKVRRDSVSRPLDGMHYLTKSWLGLSSAFYSYPGPYMRDETNSSLPLLFMANQLFDYRAFPTPPPTSPFPPCNTSQPPPPPPAASTRSSG